MKYQVKELGLGDTLDQAIAIIKDHFGLLFGIVAFTVIPLTAVTGLIQYALLANGNVAAGMLVGVIVPLVVGVPLYILADGAIIHAVASIYVSEPTTWRKSFKVSAERFFPSFGTVILETVFVIGGCFLLVIPGILVALWFSLSQIVVVLESMAGVDALFRSKQLMTGNMIIFFVMGFILLTMVAGIGLAPAVVPQAHLQIVLSAVANGFGALLRMTVTVVFYFSCRCKAENFDLYLSANRIKDESVQPVDVGAVAVE